MKMKKIPQPSQDRLEVLARMAEYEKAGGDSFFLDVENDPPSHTLMPDEVDYLNRKPADKLKCAFARTVAAFYEVSVKRKYRIRVEGAENIRNIEGGAVITSNHFATTENIAVKAAAECAEKKHRLYKVVREGNFFMPGTIGFLLKYCDTLPLSGNIHTMSHFNRAVDEVLQKGDFLLVYPEQAMWWNYKKPREYRIGAFYYAAKNKVPVVPCFVTLEGSGIIENNGFEGVYYTIHIMPPIYPDESVRQSVDAARMLAENRALCCAKYEEVYGEKPW